MSRSLTMLALLTMSLVPALRVTAAELNFELTTGAGVTLPDPDLGAGTDPAPHGTIIISPMVSHRWPLEARLNYVRVGDFDNGGLAMTDGSINMQWGSSRAREISLYLTGGAGLMRLQREFVFALNTGAGGTAQIGRRTALRLEGRIVTFDAPYSSASGNAANWEFSLGLSFRGLHLGWGGDAPPVVAPTNLPQANYPVPLDSLQAWSLVDRDGTIIDANGNGLPDALESQGETQGMAVIPVPVPSQPAPAVETPQQQLAAEFRDRGQVEDTVVFRGNPPEVAPVSFPDLDVLGSVLAAIPDGRFELSVHGPAPTSSLDAGYSIVDYWTTNFEQLNASQFQLAHTPEGSDGHIIVRRMP